ncbi:MAG: hypothetical protein LWX51_17910 [Deltaproteobacteria bacterium]|nr:hypothetical protein [Deltaproteobacteria bacterium]
MQKLSGRFNNSRPGILSGVPDPGKASIMWRATSRIGSAARRCQDRSCDHSFLKSQFLSIQQPVSMLMYFLNDLLRRPMVHFAGKRDFRTPL